MVDFWWVVGSNPVRGSADIEAALSGVRSRLRELGLAELTEFQERLVEHLDVINRGDLAAIPVELSSGQVFEQTEDHFLYARCACVLSGEQSVRAVLDDELSFAQFVTPRLQSAEMLLHEARTEYESRTGQRMSG
jgi:hypothetical protein